MKTPITYYGGKQKWHQICIESAVTVNNKGAKPNKRKVEVLTANYKI